MAPRNLYLSIRHNELHVLCEKAKGKLSYQSYSLHEMSRDGLISRLAAFKNEGIQKAVVILPREELLVQNFETSCLGAELKKDLYNKLEKSFPYKPEDLAYGMRVTCEDAAGLKGVFIASPAEKMANVIEPVEAAGYEIEDVVASDEALCSYVFQTLKGARKKCIIFDIGQNSLEYLIVENGKIKFSRSLELGAHDFLEESELLTLDYDGFEKIYVCGNENHLIEADLRRHFGLLVERLNPTRDESGKVIPCALFGASTLLKNSAVSLLPSDRKIHKRKREETRSKLKVLASLGVLFLSVTLFFFAHIRFLEWKLGSLEAESAFLNNEAQELKHKSSILDASSATLQANQSALTAIKRVIMQTPPGMVYKKMSLDDKRLTLEGESSDNAVIADFLTRLKDIREIRDAKLEYARIHEDFEKKVNFYDFLITAERES